MEKTADYAELASFTGKLLRDNFGKGPSSVYVSIEHPFITIYLQDFLAPMEKVLARQNREIKIEETRDMLMEELIPEFKGQIRGMLNVGISNVYYDWDMQNQSGFIIGIIDEECVDDTPLPFPYYKEKERIHDHIIKVCEIAQKGPEHIDSYFLNDRTLVIERHGIMVEIEKEMISTGFSDQLRLAKRKLEKRLLDPKLVESLLNVHVQDKFVVWDFKRDTSYITFILKPK
ncbi:DUF2294 family protein [Bacillus sp. H-16]|uniref:Na-translocating system protein MpsC family protein n=1 Tax=Alteribacter salitolerans TaxID=2912333 RepID=UPI0019646BE1|nr:DUF2294 family protein [Alteribacter salitolerans]